MKILKTILWSFLIIAECAAVEIKAGYFFFTDSKMQKIYDNGGLDLQISSTYPLSCLDNCWTLNAYAAIEYFQRSGRSLGDNERTSIWAIPINFGLQPSYAITEDFQIYFTLGPRLFYLKQHNHSPYVYKHKSNNGVGLFVNTGLNYSLNNCFSIDLFGEYSYATIRFHSHRSGVYTRNMQVGGLTFGSGLSYAF